MSCFLNFKREKGWQQVWEYFYFSSSKLFGYIFAFAVVVFFTRYVSLSSITGAIILPIMTMLLPAKEGVDKTTLVILTFIIGVFVIYKHKSNISRLLNGTESKIIFGKKG